jgi:hypothetical protein
VLASFYTLLYSHRMRREGEDQIWWAPSCKGKFEVKSFYNILAFKRVSHFPWKSVGILRFLRIFFHLDGSAREDPYH